MSMMANLLVVIEQSLNDHAYGPMPDHDPMCRTYSGWPEQREKGCNCSVARNENALRALNTVRRVLEEDGYL